MLILEPAAANCGIVARLVILALKRIFLAISYEVFGFQESTIAHGAVESSIVGGKWREVLRLIAQNRRHEQSKVGAEAKLLDQLLRPSAVKLFDTAWKGARIEQVFVVNTSS